jgi:hypothetical protein
VTVAASRSDAGAAGAWTLFTALLGMFAVLQLVIGVWRVVDAKAATDAAAREGARTFVEGVADPDPAVALTRAEVRGRSVLAEQGWPAGTVDGQGLLARCAVATFTARVEVPPIAIPFLGDLGAVGVSSTHRERVDPLRAGLEGAAGCVG